MVDTVNSQTLLDGERLVVQKFTNISDGTGETNVVKVNVSALSANSFGVACTGVKINKIWATTQQFKFCFTPNHKPNIPLR